MSNVLPCLRQVLDVIPSADESQPGVLLRDPFRYTDGLLFLPPGWALALNFLDGAHTELDLQAFLTNASGQILPSSDIQQFVRILNEQGFLETARFHELREKRET